MSLNRMSSTRLPIRTAGSAAGAPAATNKTKTSERGMWAAPVAGRDVDQCTDQPQRPPPLVVQAARLHSFVQAGRLHYGKGPSYNLPRHRPLHTAGVIMEPQGDIALI